MKRLMVSEAMMRPLYEAYMNDRKLDTDDTALELVNRVCDLLFSGRPMERKPQFGWVGFDEWWEGAAEDVEDEDECEFNESCCGNEEDK